MKNTIWFIINFRKISITHSSLNWHLPSKLRTSYISYLSSAQVESFSSIFPASETLTKKCKINNKLFVYIIYIVLSSIAHRLFWLSITCTSISSFTESKYIYIYIYNILIGNFYTVNNNITW